MSNKSGRFGAVNGIPGVRDWSITNKATYNAFVDSGTGSGTGRRGGVKDWSGKFNNTGGTPIAMPGETIAFKGYTHPTTGVYGTAGPTYSGNVIVDTAKIDWNWTTNAELISAIGFSGNGAVAEAAEIVTDTAVIARPTSAEGKIVIGTGSDEFELCAKTASLSFSAANPKTVNSCTANYNVRDQGPLDWTLSVVCDQESQAAFPFDIDDIDDIYCYVDSTDHWLLQWGIFTGYTNIVVNRKGEIISQTLNWEMTAVSALGALGKIFKPGDAVVQWWPDAIV